MRNTHQSMIADLKKFVSTASYEQLTDRKDLLTGFLMSGDFELAQVAKAGISLINDELQARKEVDLLGSDSDAQ